MEKEKLKKFVPLNATRNMMKLAKKEVPVKKYLWKNEGTDSYQCGIYMRCMVLEEILKVAFFLTRDMRLGSRNPIYELFIDKESDQFITWDTVHQTWKTAKLDMLDWPVYSNGTPPYITQKESKCIRQYLDVSADGYEGILEYQREARRKHLEQKHRKETKPWDLVMNQVPALPKDWKRWVDKQGIHQNYIFYTYSRKGAIEGYCTWCEKMVPISTPKHNASGSCKCCGHKIQFKSSGKTGHFFTKDESVYLLQRCEDGFIIRQFKAWRHYSKGSYESPTRSCMEERRVIYDEHLQARTFYYGCYRNTEDRWIQGQKPYNGWQYYYSYSDDTGSVYKRTMPTLAHKELGRTGLPQMIRAIDRLDPELYLEVLKVKPYLEQLVKGGLTELAWDVINGHQSLEIIESSDLYKMLGIDKNRMRRLRNRRGGCRYLNWLKFEKRNNLIIADLDISYFEAQEIKPDDIAFISDRMSAHRICRYLKKQYEISGRNPKELLSTWQDYLSLAKRLKMDVKQEFVYKPRDLIKGHDEAVELCGGENVAKRAAEIAEDYPDIDEICQSIKSKYEFEDEDYKMILPDRIEDIMREGYVLGHCLHWSDIYFDRIQRRESYIAFLRKTEHPETPYYTLEIEPGGVARQKRTVGDKQNADFNDAENFIRKWQKEIQKNLTQEDLLIAKESAKLRVKEFQELREKGTKIWHGHLAGKLLVDVLEADLMEIERTSRTCEVVQDVQTGISALPLVA